MFVIIRLNMGLTLSMLEIQFCVYRLIARKVVTPSSEITSLKGKFCDVQEPMLVKLKNLHSEVFTEVNWGRLLLFLNFVEQIGLTEEEWKEVYDILVPTLSQL